MFPWQQVSIPPRPLPGYTAGLLSGQAGDTPTVPQLLPIITIPGLPPYGTDHPKPFSPPAYGPSPFLSLLFSGVHTLKEEGRQCLDRWAVPPHTRQGEVGKGLESSELESWAGPLCPSTFLTSDWAPAQRRGDLMPNHRPSSHPTLNEWGSYMDSCLPAPPACAGKAGLAQCPPAPRSGTVLSLPSS